jgi:hypothetical protein
MDSNFQFRARAGVLTGLYRRRPSKVLAFPPKRPVSCTRDRWFESVSLQRRVSNEPDKFPRLRPSCRFEKQGNRRRPGEGRAPDPFTGQRIEIFAEPAVLDQGYRCRAQVPGEAPLSRLP